MTPGARLAAAIEILEQTETAGEAPSAVVDRYFRRRRYAGSKDRRHISESVFRILRRRARLDWWITRAAPDAAPTPRTQVIADLAAEREPSLAELFSGDGHAPPPLSDAETDLAGTVTGLEHPGMPGWVRLEYPEWLSQELEKSLGETLDVEITALNQPAPVDLRVNTLKTDPRGVAKSLAKQGIETVPCAVSPVGLRVTGRKRLGQTRAFKDGLFEIQDEGSQLAALLCDARPGMQVLDFCAGAGGKTLALAAAMENKGRIVACDVSAKRLSRMDDRVKRAGVHTIQPHAFADGDKPDLPGGGPKKFDRVLVDAPCSGIGTWRRDPTQRWRLTKDRLAGYIRLQAEILANAGRCVKPGGRLIYATCSMLGSENEEQVELFSKAHPAFRVLDGGEVWRQILDAPCPATGPYLHISPAATGTDGFFIAILENTG